MRLVAERRSQDTVRRVSSKEKGGVAISVTESIAPEHEWQSSAPSQIIRVLLKRRVGSAGKKNSTNGTYKRTEGTEKKQDLSQCFTFRNFNEQAQPEQAGCNGVNVGGM